MSVTKYYISYLFYAVIFTVVITACGGRKKGKFSKKELSWLVYNEGDTINFKDSNGKLRQLLVDYKTELSQVKKYYPIEAEIEIYNPDGNEHFRIYLLKDEDVFKRYLRSMEVYRPFDLVQPKDSVVVNDKLYNQVYVFEEDTTEFDSGIWKVYYNHQAGIIKYIMKDHTICELVSDNSA